MISTHFQQNELTLRSYIKGAVKSSAVQELLQYFFKALKFLS